MREATLEMTDGFLVHAIVMAPEGNPIGHIHLLHGMGEHIGRYEEFAHYLVGKGYIVSGHDHRGHGKTAKMNGLKGHFSDTNGFTRVVQDAYEIISVLRDQYPSPRFILFGHSMGSFIARRYVQLHGSEVDLAIFTGTGGDPVISRARSGSNNTTGKRSDNGSLAYFLLSIAHFFCAVSCVVR